jgi:hypothetical protein
MCVRLYVTVPSSKKDEHLLSEHDEEDEEDEENAVEDGTSRCYPGIPSGIIKTVVYVCALAYFLPRLR